MSLADKFDSESKQKMKEMIELSSESEIEYFTTVKADYTLGDIIKGKKKCCDPRKIIKSENNVIGLFHTHPHDQNFFKESDLEKESLDFVAAALNLNEKQKEVFGKRVKENSFRTSAFMSPNDLRFSLAYNLTAECIGTIDKNMKPFVLCFELYPDAKERLRKQLGTLKGKEKDIFLKVYNNWIGNKPPEESIDFAESYVLLKTYKIIVKEESEIKFD